MYKYIAHAKGNDTMGYVSYSAAHTSVAEAKSLSSFVGARETPKLVAACGVALSVPLEPFLVLAGVHVFFFFFFFSRQKKKKKTLPFREFIGRHTPRHALRRSQITQWIKTTLMAIRLMIVPRMR